MPRLHNDGLDDPVADAGTLGFVGIDATTAPVMLDDRIAADARNLLMDEQGLAVGRPAVETFALAHTAGDTAWAVDGLHWYDTPAKQCLLVARGGRTYAVDPETGTAQALPVGAYAAGLGPVRTAQVVEHAYRPRSGGGLAWLRHTAGAWTAGEILNFKDGAVTTPMPTFGPVCAHRYRLFAAKAGSDELYASAFLPNPPTADATDWPLLNSLRVGEGEGDPIVALLPFQESLLLVLKAASVWMVDTAAPLAADWSVRRVSGLTGCRAAATALQIGQDVLFASPYGVVSVGALAQQNSISASQSVSAPIALPLRNGSPVWASRWRDYYLLGWDDTELHPEAANRIWVFDTRSKAWVGRWDAAFGPLTLAPGVVAPAPGWTCACTGRPLGGDASYLADAAGRIARWADGPAQDTRSPAGADPLPIPQELMTKAWAFDEPSNWKRALRLELTFHRQTVGAYSVHLHPDGEYTGTPAGESVANNNGAPFPLRLPLGFIGRARTGLVRNLLPLIRRRWRDMAVRISSAAPGRLSIRAVRLSALPDTAPMNEA